VKKKTWTGVAGTAVVFAVAGYVWAQELGVFRVPEYTDDGVKKSEITGKSAKWNSGIANIKDFKIEFYEADGETIKMSVKAPQCTYNQRGRIAKSSDAVRIENPTMVVTGEDFAWDGERELFKIFKNAKVVIRGANDLAKAAPQKSE
jgi:hypothetical protein